MRGKNVEEIKWVGSKFTYAGNPGGKPIILFANKNQLWNIREAILLEKNSFAIKLAYETHEPQEEWFTHEHYQFTNSIGIAKKGFFGKYKKIYY